MGLAAAATVLIAVLVALTLLPAILGLLKSKAFGGRLPPLRAEAGRGRPGPQQRRPLGPLRRQAPGRARAPGRRRPRRPRDPAQGPAPGVPDRQHRVDRHHAAQGVRPDVRGVRPGPRGPAARRGRRPRHRRRRRPRRGVPGGRRLGGRPGRRRQRAGRRHQRRYDEEGKVTTPATGALVQITPCSGPRRHRDRGPAHGPARRPGRIQASTGTDIGITGQTAIETDVSERLSGALPIYLADRDRAGVHPADDRLPLDPGAAHRDDRLPVQRARHARARPC